MSNELTVTAPAGLPYIDIEREFDAPVGAVFRAHRDPDLVRQWMAPDGFVLDIDHWDFVSHGSYRYAATAPDGSSYAFNGTFHVVRENEFAVQTFEFDGMPDLVSIESARFEELPGGRTRIRVHSVYPDVATRDGAAEGMAEGLVDGYRKLEALVAAAPAAV